MTAPSPRFPLVGLLGKHVSSSFQVQLKKKKKFQPLLTTPTTVILLPATSTSIVPFDVNGRLLTKNIWVGPHDSRVNAEEVPTAADKELHSQTRDRPDSGTSPPAHSLTSLTLPLWPSCGWSRHTSSSGPWQPARLTPCSGLSSGLHRCPWPSPRSLWGRYLTRQTGFCRRE